VQVARQLADWPRWAYIEKTLASDEIIRAHAQMRLDTYVLTAWILQTQVDVSELESHLHRARDLFPRDAEIWLASGSAEELQARVEIMRHADPRMNPSRLYDMRQMMRREHLTKAESYYREAIALDATLTEAHARLGHVLYELARLPEARLALTRARELTQTHPDDAQENVIAYLASLFLAGVADASGNGDEALTAYEEIVKRWPGCQSGHVGLSRAFEARGERSLALGALQPLWSEHASRRCPSDPWWLYDFGQAWRIDARLTSLRARVKS
jgi:tetratricopeptide (TPR) repeat protein